MIRRILEILTELFTCALLGAFAGAALVLLVELIRALY